MGKLRLTGVLLAAMLLAGCTNRSGEPAPAAQKRLDGATAQLGGGTVASYAVVDASNVPAVIGLAIQAAALEGLPAAPSDMHHCFDSNGDKKLDERNECTGAHEKVVPLPSELARRTDLPFKWILLNWNPNGHIPPGVYDVPHFDLHFMIEPIENVFAIERGTCGPESVRCDQFAVATKPLPANYVPPDFKSVGAAAPAMGDHLIDMTGSELHGQPFTRSWIYGAYDGRITFYEEMFTLAHLRSQPNTCHPIKQTPAVAVAGYYPTQSCIRYDATRNEYTVSIEQFQRREPAPPSAELTPPAPM